MNHDICHERIAELEAQLDDALVTIDSLYDEVDRKDTRIRILEGLLRESRKDHRVQHDPDVIA